MRKVVFLATIALSFSAHAATQVGLVSQIRASQGESIVGTCSATMIRDERRPTESQCRIVTNAHCAPTGASLSLHHVVDGKDQWSEMQVLKRSARLDLIEIGTENVNLRKAIAERCATLPALGTDYQAMNSASREASFRAAGWVDGVATDHHSRSADWKEKTTATSKYSEHFTGPDHASDVLYQIAHLNVFPGMSGGLLLKHPGEMYGLLTRYGPLEQNAYARPLPIVLRWLRGEITYADDAESARIETLAERDLLRRGKFNRDAIGDNNHADGTERFKSLKSLKPDERSRYLNHLVREADEGYPLDAEFIQSRPELKGHILLAVGGKQIDGFPHYLDYVLHPANRAIVTRPANGYLDLETRRNLLRRLAGVYTSVAQKTLNKPRTLFEQPGQHEVWKVLYTGNEASTIIKVDAEEQYITLVSDPTEMHFEAPPFGGTIKITPKVPFPGQRRHIDIRFSSDAKSLVAEVWNPISAPATTQMLCDNRHYLKLICRDEDGIRTFSLAYDGGEYLNYRLSWLAAVDAKYGIRKVSYLSGTLKKTDVSGFRNENP